MKKSIIILLATILPVLAQQQANDNYVPWYGKANRYYELENPTASTDSLALISFSKAIRLLTGKLTLSSTLYDCYIKSGNIHQGRQRYTDAVPFYHFVLKEAPSQKDTLNLYQAHLYMGSCKYSLNEIDSATYYLEKAYSYVQKNKALPDLTVLFNSLGIIYFESANYSQAINYFQLALNELNPNDESYSESFVSFKNNIAACFARLGKNKEALITYKELLPYRQLLGSLMQNIGHMYYSLQQYDSALIYLNKVPFSQTSNYVKLINEKARIYMQKGLLAQSEDFFDNAIALNKKLPGNLKNKDKANSYLYRSQLAFKQGLTDEAITWCNVALEELHFAFKWSKGEELPPNVTQVVSPVTFFEVLKFKAQLLQQKFSLTGNQRYLQLCLQTWMMAVKTSNYIKTNFDNDEASLFFTESISSIYKTASLTATLLYEQTGKEKYLDDYLFIAESFKGNILYRNLVAASAKDKGALPYSLVQREKELKQLLAVYTTRVNNLTSGEGLSLVQKKITGIQYELSRLQKQFEKFPEYNNSEKPNAADSISAKKIQQQLSTGTSVVQYLWCDSLLICFSATASNATLRKFVIDDGIKTQLAQYINALHNTPEGLRFDEYKIAENLYSFFLVQPAAGAADKKKLIILPDGPLNYLPFETLLRKEEKRDWLAKDKIISYHYSFSLLLNKNITPRFNNSKFAAIPFSDEGILVKDRFFSKLTYSEQETETLKEARYSSIVATKKIFTEQSRNSALIHLATHAVSGNDTLLKPQTFIQFYYRNGMPVENSRLYLHEIYNLRFKNHPLIILSACETATGNITNGEGLLSLSRAFLYAGASGIISSLWKAEDRVTAYLMSRFHYHLQTGMETEAALQQARIDFLNDTDIDVRLKTPNYWGHFIYVGETGREITAETGNSFWLIKVAAFVAFLIAGGYLWRCRQKSQMVSVN